MIELSIEEKAKRYDELLAMARECITYVPDDAVNKYMLNMFPELKESGDERIRKFISNELACLRAIAEKGSDRYEELTNAIAWLEKQGSQNLANSAKTCKDEQKPNDKVEPNFHEGDWITFYGGTPLKVTKIEKETNGVLDYLLLNKNGQVSAYNKNYVDENARLWSIKDAKDGDVLVDKDNNIGIYKEIEGIYWDSYIYIGCDGELRGVSIGGRHEQIDTHPATKEQLDKLFAKMKEAGLGWNAEKKELKKIEDEPKNFKQQVMDETANLVKDYISQKPVKWSESDEYLLGETIQHLEELIRIDKAKHCGVDVQYYQRDIDWLKSLRPQKQWKPSDEQMYTLEAAIANYTEQGLSYVKDGLNNLYEQLKKL